MSVFPESPTVCSDSFEDSYTTAKDANTIVSTSTLEKGASSAGHLKDHDVSSQTRHGNIISETIPNHITGIIKLNPFLVTSLGSDGDNDYDVRKHHLNKSATDTFLQTISSQHSLECDSNNRASVFRSVTMSGQAQHNITSCSYEKGNVCQLRKIK